MPKKEQLKEKARESYEDPSEENKAKNDDMVADDTNIS